MLRLQSQAVQRAFLKTIMCGLTAIAITACSGDSGRPTQFQFLDAAPDQNLIMVRVPTARNLCIESLSLAVNEEAEEIGVFVSTILLESTECDDGDDQDGDFGVTLEEPIGQRTIIDCSRQPRRAVCRDFLP